MPCRASRQTGRFAPPIWELLSKISLSISKQVVATPPGGELVGCLVDNRTSAMKDQLRFGIFVVCLVTIGWDRPALSFSNVPPQWIHLSSATGDLPKPGGSHQQTACVVIDADKDGVNDFVLGFRQKAPAVVWYRHAKDGWDRYVIETNYLTIEAGGAVCDIDGDGDPDLVLGGDWQSNEVWWWENPYPKFDPNVRWKRRVIKTGGATQHHDQVFGDFKGTGKPQLAFWNQGSKTIFLADIPSDPRTAGTWPKSAIFSPNASGEMPYAEGMASGDIDGDGQLDLLACNYWFKHIEGNRFKPIQISRQGGRIACGQLVEGGLPEVVISPGDGTGSLNWYSCDSDPQNTKNWTTYLLVQNVVHGHSLQLADIDGDGHLDIFCAEMAKWHENQSQPDNSKAKAWIFYGDGHGGFRKTVFSTGIGFHEARVADLNGDGRPDILDKPYNWETPRVDIWLQKSSASADSQGKEVAALSVQDFLNSVGVCTHIGQGIDDPVKSAEALSYAGIRNIRDDGNPRHLQDWISVHRTSGVKVVLTQSGPNRETIDRLIQISKQLAAAGALLAMEGPNEPNNWAVTFDGHKSQADSTSVPVANWQREFYRRVKSDPVLKDYSVFHSSEAGGAEPDNVGLQFLTIPTNAGTLFPAGTKYADYANVHNYICRKPNIIDNMAWSNADPVFRGWTDGIDAEYGKTWRKGFAGYSNEELATLPRVTTETGWATGEKGLTQEQQGRLYLNIYMAQFKQGFKYTFIYMLHDAGGSDSGYGIFERDYHPKKSAIYLHNLTTILSDKGAVELGKLDYHIPDPPVTVHDLLLQKSNGTFALVVWNEKADGSDEVTVKFGDAHSSVKVYDPTTGVSPTQNLAGASSVQLELSDHPIIIEVPRNSNRSAKSP